MVVSTCMCLPGYLHYPPQNEIFIASVFITLKQNSAVFSDINSTDSLQIYHGYRKPGKRDRNETVLKMFNLDIYNVL